MTCIITDDEQNSRETLRHLLEAIAPDMIILAETESTAKAKTYIEKLQPDLLFLDINMPQQSGIEFLEANPNLNCHVIFTTAYNEYAVKAFRLNAIDFLLKPIDPDELEVAIEKVKNQTSFLHPQQIANTKQYIDFPDEKNMQRLAISTTEGIHFLNLNEIIWMESLGSYTKIKLENQSPIIASKVLKEFDELLNGFTFVRVHQSNLVNLYHVKKYIKGDGGQLIMSDGTTIEVSRRKKDELLEILNKISIR